MNKLVDATGVEHVPLTTPARIACLVPSITELLFALDLDEQIIARTHFCIHPVDRMKHVTSVGGTKKINHDKLRVLSPTHVILNIDENTKEMAEQLAEYVPHLIVTHPLAPQDNLALYQLLGGIFNRQAQAQRLCKQFTVNLDTLQSKIETSPKDVLYLIWRDPWMTISPDTYISRTLALLGWRTIPMQSSATTRYPAINIDEQLLNTIDLVLFSSEPYSFTQEDIRQFAHDYAIAEDKLTLIDGEMTSWYGSRAIQGLTYLAEFTKKKALL